MEIRQKVAVVSKDPKSYEDYEFLHSIAREISDVSPTAIIHRS